MQSASKPIAGSAPSHGCQCCDARPSKSHASKASKSASSKPPVPIRFTMITVSDRCAAGTAEDLSGPAGIKAIQELLEIPGRVKFVSPPNAVVVPDDRDSIQAAIREATAPVRSSDEPVPAGLVLTSGGTGFAPRDITPEATAELLERQAPGLLQAVQAAILPKVPTCILSRGVAGMIGTSLVINCPGKPKAVRETVEILASVLPHALSQLRGSVTGHGAHKDPRLHDARSGNG